MNVVQWAVNNWPKDISRTGVEWSRRWRREREEAKQKRGEF